MKYYYVVYNFTDPIFNFQRTGGCVVETNERKFPLGQMTSSISKGKNTQCIITSFMRISKKQAEEHKLGNSWSDGSDGQNQK